MSRHYSCLIAFAVAALFVASCATAPVADRLRTDKLREIDSAIEQAIADKKLPGGVIWIERNGTTYHKAYGSRALVPEREPMTADTIFDAASITKVAATTPAIWILIERGKVDLDAPVSRYLPEFSGEWRDEVTIRHLLTHASGLRPDIDLDKPWSGHDTAMAMVYAERPRNRPGFVFRYSDINFELLGEVVHRITGQPLDEFVRREIFEPLGMKDTGFRPCAGASNQCTRVAPTERLSDGTLLRGVVHDPTARRMGGVAGHAGLFTTAEDLAKYARALLAGGGGILKPETVKAMTTVQSPPNVVVKRAGGFDLDSGFSRPRGDLFPFGSFGHTGFTGGFLWIDPASNAFYVFLSNRVHPDGKGSVLALQRKLGTLIAEAVGATVIPSRADGEGSPPDERTRSLAALGMTGPRFPNTVRWITGGADTANGIDVLHARGYRDLQGLRIGLITNHTGIDRAGNPTIDLLRSAPDVKLVALFSPEHGIRGTFDEKVGDTTDAVSGLPIYSLYGERRKPSSEQLANLDALVFDIQDIGTRFYTYISTMGLAMEAAAEANIKFFVLDRVNPIGGIAVEGFLPDGKQSFVAHHPIAVRHGMTVGELAKMFREEKSIGVDLTVIQLRGWKREWWQDEAGLPWINTSPNMRSLPAAGLYPGIGILERVVSIGRGTPTPFEWIGAPYIRGADLAREMNALRLPGILFEPASFTPTASVFKDQPCQGVRFVVIDRKALLPVRTGVALAVTLRRMYPESFDVAKLDLPAVSNELVAAIRSGQSLAAIVDSWKDDESQFGERRAKYLIY